MARELPVAVAVPDADAMRDLGARLATILRRGDLVIATGDLGAGKTTLTQGLGAGLGVQGPVISPTFVLSRVHQPTGDGPWLVHVDAYRLTSFAELEDIDLEASLDDAVTLVEWGAGVAEGLAEDRLEIDIRRSIDPADETRWVFVSGVGPRWTRDDLASLTLEDA
ncbi:MAG: tRNA (adenosine(37)-N6)-threonylcarbamoyltransferase complex ATPase subunit type 1 TsaE [Mobilicoccus sp.]|nr:tRNA (adenosine(37)-N6)-threonylcarbamoyltransferase complex ATPase subunit type 1 TsaE [Mobilicoccus sp.]